MSEEKIIELFPDLSRLCLQLCRNRDDAEDLFQDTLERALKSRNRQDDILNLKSWLYTICINRYRDNLRRGSIEHRVTFRDEEEKEFFFCNLPDPERMEYYAELYDALSRLPADQRTMLTLKYFQGYQNKEIAGMMGIGEKAVASGISKAMRVLRRYMEDE